MPSIAAGSGLISWARNGSSAPSEARMAEIPIARRPEGLPSGAFRFDGRLFISALSVLIFLSLWETAPRLHLVDIFYTSQPSRVVAAGAEILRSGSFLRDVSLSLSEFALGYSLAVALGVSFGLLLGSFPTLRFLFDPLVMAVYAMPELA